MFNAVLSSLRTFDPLSSVSDSGSNVRRLLKTALNIWLGSMGTAAPFLG